MLRVVLLVVVLLLLLLVVVVLVVLMMLAWLGHAIHVQRRHLRSGGGG